MALNLPGLVAEMRRLGVVRLCTEEVELELGPEPSPDPPGVAPESMVDRVCECGHPFDQHGPAGCLVGCGMERCIGSGQHPEPEGDEE